jgi:hypothetical protein
MRRATLAVGAILASVLRPVLAQDDQNVACKQLNAVVWGQNDGVRRLGALGV